MSHKVSFKIRNVSMVGIGEECFTAGSVYTRELEDDVYGRLSSLKDNGFVEFISDIIIAPEGTVAPVVESGTPSVPEVVESPIEVAPPEVVESPIEVAPPEVVKSPIEVVPPEVEEEIPIPPGVEEVILQSVDTPSRGRKSKREN